MNEITTLRDLLEDAGFYPDELTVDGRSVMDFVPEVFDYHVLPEPAGEVLPPPTQDLYILPVVVGGKETIVALRRGDTIYIRRAKGTEHNDDNSE